MSASGMRTRALPGLRAGLPTLRAGLPGAAGRLEIAKPARGYAGPSGAATFVRPPAEARVDPDLVGGQLGGQVAGQRCSPAFGHRVPRGGCGGDGPQAVSRPIPLLPPTATSF